MSVKLRKPDRRRKLREQQRRAQLHHHQQVFRADHRLYASLVTESWEDEGIAGIYVAREIAPGRVTMISFLVDLWGMGLKDADGECDIGCSEFDERMERAGREIRLIPLQLGLARHMVYGGIERANELGFRLPKRYERWTAVLGPLTTGESPDRALFGRNGKIMLVCSERDLEARLVGTTVDKLLRRPDVDFVIGTDGATLVDPESDAALDSLSEAERAFLDAVRRWCFATQRVPHPLLPEAIGTLFEVLHQSLPENLESLAGPNDIPEEDFRRSAEATSGFLALSFVGREAELAAAVQQLQDFTDSTASFEAFRRLVDPHESGVHGNSASIIPEPTRIHPRLEQRAARSSGS